MRKVIQIDVVPDNENAYKTVFALCDDGSIWETYYRCPTWEPWERLPDVPQDEESGGYNALD